ncbi:hypothetical protein M9980_10665 [Sphingomonas donggukensis]|uniref:Rap1a immunity protein domain-containing protein n=1 Tax=Sphingomonas donggukensis TaxID=2949093 RepID=A0ABY4TRL3_9SPHN|nr:hypothetical protein [Sphingomonas donggukensis]URW75020.1 hypothetical protein M9980_10665 [Sphingomonas donggukensis]
MARWAVLGAVALTTIATPAAAQTMTVQQFLDRVAAVKALGPAGLLSDDMTALKAEMAAVTRAYAADKQASAQAGKPISCAPEGAKIRQAEFMAAFEAIPAAQRGMSLKQAFYGIVAKRFPCPVAGGRPKS